MRSLIRAVALGALASLMLAGTAHAKPPSPGGTSDFRGVNWADPRDNYASDAVVPSGLSTADDYRTVYRVTTRMVGDFRRNLGANTLRLPINPASVGTAWWRSYRAAIDAATAAGDKVILSYWEADTSKDGLIDDVAAWDRMWDTVVREYGRNPRVYFEAMNEPHGYTLDQWVAVNTGFIARHRSVPRGRVVVSGTGYNDNVTGVGAAPELRGTLLSLHFYGFWASDTEKSAWLANLTPRIGSYGYRTIIDEAGAPMTIGLNYGAHNGNTSTAYFAALTETARAQHMGIVYWPGLRFGDSYSITSVGADGHLVNNSASGVAQLRWGWGFGTTEPANDDPAAPPGEPLVNLASGRCVDVPGFSTTDGTALGIWDCNGGGNQSFNASPTGELTVYGSKCVTAGNPVTIGACTGADTQQWTFTAEQTVTSGASLCLDAPDGSAVVVAPCSGTATQTWARVPTP
ncbi:hypothetical protein BJ973_004134 [Actinoplanes tereljensis]|uniref:Ricin B lectin domain-containing protein n=1 Tax=Paractinoplanes tereljensis TaxID=571912 RepID=A0A919TVN4_9ACTN|nr:ricin-type beta-trefoil lectin domain protein [Actinoplanes tereljensis]GIF23524.1 hypothetical protein Ate02nite_62540 [Actinoplanes tereljensis]